MSKKYELLEDDVIIVDCRKLYRIRALCDFDDVKKGDLGGYVQYRENLRDEGNCWVYDDAIVYDAACIYGNAKICDHVKIHGYAKIHDNVEIHDYSCICECSHIHENAFIYGHVNIKGGDISGNARIYEHVEIHENPKIYGYAKIHGYAEIHGRCQIYGYAEIYRRCDIYGYAKIYEHAEIHDYARVHGRAEIRGYAQIRDHAEVYEHAEIGGDAELYGNIILSNDVVINDLKNKNTFRLGKYAYIKNKRDVIVIGPIGSRNDFTTFYKTRSKGIYVCCGCFNGPLEVFEKAVKETHGDNEHGIEYMKAIEMAKTRFILIENRNIYSYTY